jgi:lactate permease
MPFLTAQALGSNTGCMISVSKVVSACAVVGLNGSESKVMRVTIVVALLYALLIGVMVNILI